MISGTGNEKGKREKKIPFPFNLFLFPWLSHFQGQQHDKVYGESVTTINSGRRMLAFTAYECERLLASDNRQNFSEGADFALGKR